jgi:outer membrane protein assembly factor BamB
MPKIITTRSCIHTKGKEALYMRMRNCGWNRKLGLSLLLFIVMFSLFAAGIPKMQFAMADGGSGTDDWTMFRHDAQHSGYSTSTAPSTNQTQWSFTTGSDVYSSPAVADGKVYIGANDGRIYCLNAATGALIWTYKTGNDARSPAVADGKVYVGSWDDKVYCLNAASGASIWNYTTSGAVPSSPAVADGKVYIGSYDSKIHCINAATGTLNWSYATGGLVYSSPAVADGKVYAGSRNGNLYCLNAVEGTLNWSYTTGNSVDSSPAVVADRVYVGSDDAKVYCLNASDGAHIWNYTTGGNVQSSPAVADSKVFVGSLDGKVYCLDAENGTFIWNYTTGNILYSSPAVADGKVFVGSNDYKVYCLNAADGAFIWSYATGSNVYSSPAVADGVVYVASTSRKVYAFSPTFIWNFDNAFKFNSVRMIYPSEQTPKPLGCSSAMVSDWTASAFIYTKLDTVVEGTDTNSAFVNQTSGKPLGAANSGLISFGGPVVNPVVAYAESAATPTGDRAPVMFYQNAGTCYFQFRNGTSILEASLPSSAINNNRDMFVIEVYRDGDGRNEMLCYGFGWKGTYAAGKYFETEIYSNLNSYPYSWIIVLWFDANGDGFVNTAADGDTYTVIATGQK